MQKNRTDLIYLYLMMQHCSLMLSVIKLIFHLTASVEQRVEFLLELQVILQHQISCPKVILQADSILYEGLRLLVCYLNRNNY